jgi:2-polyprenyl-6-methoxyphenol hydroxylase-like FAD-dependent oxidoreductase
MENRAAARKHAIVIGGSVAGLLAACVLSDRYEHITVIDRDAFPAFGEHRRGVPQSVHTHGLLAGGHRAMNRFFPGLSDELLAAGAVAADVLAHSRWYFEGGLLSRCASDLDGLLLSRPLLEGVIRKRVQQIRNVTMIESCAVESLTVSNDKLRVTGVRTATEMIPADLVVDASGRGSHSPAWLEANGYAKPNEERVEVSISHTTRLFRRSVKDLNGDCAVIVPATPDGKCGGVMLAQEGLRWIVTLVGYFGRSAAGDLDGFTEFARRLASPDIYDLIRKAEPIGDAHTSRFPASVRRYYEKLDRFPEGFLVFGDAVCSFNPVYGQGMSVAALQATALARLLAVGQLSSREFFARVAKVVDSPWKTAVAADLRFPETVGPSTMAVDFINWYLPKLRKAAHRDPALSVAFMRVSNLVALPSSLMHPGIIMRVVKANVLASMMTIAHECERHGFAGFR